MKDIARLLRDMIGTITTIESYAALDYDAFLADEKSQDAIMYNLIILGEAANQIPQDFQEKFPDIPWASIIGTKNIIVHGYDQVKLQIVWDIIQQDLMPLKNNISKIL